MRLLVLCAITAIIIGVVPAVAGTMSSSSGSATQVTIDNYAFKPAMITVVPGTKVTWKNMDDDPHTVTADDGSFDSKGLAQGDSFSFTFKKPGTYNYHCSVHPFMKATVIVREGGS
jgi:plastocyanin